MPIDYSKWDHIELSDDSDIEVHPNVDKRSFINWKQRDIHEKRQQRNIEIKSILVQLTMYAKLNERVDFLLESLTNDELLDNSVLLAKLNNKYDPQEKFDYEKLIKDKGDTLRKGLRDLHFDAEETQNTPTYNEMIEDLLIQLKDEHQDANSSAEKLKEYLKEHRNRIDDVLSKQTIKLDDLLYQKSLLISSDDYHTGFDRSFLNKDKEEDVPEESQPVESKGADKSVKKEKVTTVETINSPASSSQEKSLPEKSEKEILDELTVLPATESFAKISSSDLKKSGEFLLKHTSICTEHQKDALIMTAFDYQLEGNSAAAKQIIHQSLLLQYIAQLAGPQPAQASVINAIKLFISKVSEASPARAGFMEDVQNTFNHIKNRCEIIREEQAAKDGEEEALIQLKSLDENTELLVNIPAENTPEYEIFTTKLSKEFQDAVRTQSLDEVNKEFAKLKVEEAEKVLEIFNECGVIGISGYLEDEEEFQELQKQYQDQELQGEEQEQLQDTVEEQLNDEEENEPSTVDIVD